MPTNLPPDYFNIEEEYRAAKSPVEKIALLEEMLSIIPKHKGTDRLRGNLRRKLAKLKAQSEMRRSVGRRHSAFHIDVEGAAQVVVVGPTNVGKSALVAALTHATPEVAAFPYTTWSPTPGMMPVEGVQIQLVDTPSLDRSVVEPELVNLIRRSDLVLLVVDLTTDPVQQLQDTIDVLVKRRIAPRQLRERYAEERRMTFIPLVVLANKNDDVRTDENFEIFRELLEREWPMLAVSAVTGRNLERLKQAVFERLEIIRVYSKAPGNPPDLNAPFVLRQGSTVAEFAGMVHQDFARNLKAARVWGSAAFDGQMVQRDHVLQDGDVVELRI